MAAARDGLAHALPGATTAQVLEVALDLMLEKQARRRAKLAGARAGVQVASTGAKVASTAEQPACLDNPTVPAGSASNTASPNALTREQPAAAPAPHPRFIPAAVRREVWLRDGQRCQFPLDLGGTCGATHRLELDHLVPLALGGQATAANLRVVCARHNRHAARLALGEAAAAQRRRSG